MLTGNKGEWSEIYTFLSLICSNELYAADENLEKLSSSFYRINAIFLTQNNELLEYRFSKDRSSIDISNFTKKVFLKTVAIKEFSNHHSRLLSILKDKNVKGAFAIESIELFLRSIFISTLKAKSTDKSDIKIELHDINTGFDSVQAFSIKSQMGSASTLLNASKATNIVYIAKGNRDALACLQNDTDSLKEKLQAFYKHDGYLSYHSIDNKIFHNNLLLIDSSLPCIYSEMLLAYYVNNKTTLMDISDYLEKLNPVCYPETEHPFYHYKIKKLLRECALGMQPSRIWHGTVDATGGYLIVKDNGEVLCYHLYNANEFENYLFKNTKFDTPSTSRHAFGTVIQGDTPIFKLNAQIRFIK